MLIKYVVRNKSGSNGSHIPSRHTTWNPRLIEMKNWWTRVPLKIQMYSTRIYWQNPALAPPGVNASAPLWTCLISEMEYISSVGLYH